MDIYRFFADMDFNHAIWLLPVIAAIHVSEEYRAFPGWATQTLGIPYSRRKFVAENIVMWVILIAGILLTLYVPGRVGLAIVLATAAGFFLNMLFHVYFTVKKGVYSPGTLTSCLLFVPTSIYIYYLAGRDGLLSVPIVIVSVLLGLGMLPVVIAVVHNAVDSGMTASALIRKIVLMGVLPFIVISVAMAVFGRETVNKVMMYATPLIVVPLVLKTLKKMKEKKKSNMTS